MAFTARTETYVNLASLTTPFDITVTKNEGTVDGDILFQWFGWYTAAGVTIDSVPSGWTLLGEYLDNTDKYALYYKIAASEGASWVWSFSDSCYVRAVCSCYTGGDFNSANPIDVVSNTAYRVGNANCIAASMAVAAAKSPLVFWAGIYSLAARTFTKPSVPTSGWIEDDDAGSTTSCFWTEVCSMIWSGSGATGDMSATISTSFTTKHAFAVALKPAAAATPAFLDIPTRFKLFARNFTDISTRFRLWVRNYADIPTRFKLWVQNHLDISTRFVLNAQTYKDIATRFKLVIGVLAYKDIATRFILQARNYVDIPARFRLWAQSFTDIGTRFALTLWLYKDIASRFLLHAREYVDTATRFILTIQNYRDIATRFRLYAQNYADIATRFVLHIQAWQDVAARFRLWVRNYVDIATRFALIVRNYLDISTRFSLHAQDFTDVALRFLLRLQDYKDIATRFKLAIQAFRDVATLFRLVIQGYIDIGTRFRIMVQPFIDVATRFRLVFPYGYRDTGTRFFLYVPTWKELQIQAELAALQATVGALPGPHAHFIT